MADGALTLTLDDATVKRLEDAAREAGVTPEALAAAHLSMALDTTSLDGGWTEARRRLAEYDRTGAFVTLDDWVADFKADVRSRLADSR